jgi:hypothetical protein
MMDQITFEQLITFEQQRQRTVPPSFTFQQMPVQPLISGKALFWGTVGIFGVAYLLSKAFEPTPIRRRCSQCRRTSHTAWNCPFIGERRPFSSSVQKTGNCKCCGRRSRKTQLHHYGGRADDSRWMEMCHPCHVYCGHNGHTQNFAVKPQYCRVAA